MARCVLLAIVWERGSVHRSLREGLCLGTLGGCGHQARRGHRDWHKYLRCTGALDVRVQSDSTDFTGMARDQVTVVWDL